MSRRAGAKESQSAERGTCCVFMEILPFALLFITYKIDCIFNDIKLILQAEALDAN